MEVKQGDAFGADLVGPADGKGHAAGVVALVERVGELLLVLAADDTRLVRPNAHS